MGKKNNNKKRGRVPEVLWRQFREKSASLSNTIVSLIPKTCNCSSKGKCLCCIFGNNSDDEDEAAMSYLIKPNDPSEYHDFMSYCFVVLPHDAPPLSPFTSFTRYWSQLEIVERAIQAILRKDSESSNVICHGYKKLKLQCNTVKALSSWTWKLALERVGDSVMYFLLMHTLIFMPINSNAHYQVVGPLVNELFPMHKPPDDIRSSMHSRYKRKRRKQNRQISNSEEPVQVHGAADLQNSNGSVGARVKDSLGTQCPNESNQSITMSEDCSLGQLVHEEQLFENLEVRQGKRVRLPSWQRHKQRKKLMLQDLGTQESSKKNLNGSVGARVKDSIGTQCPKESNQSITMSEDCSLGQHVHEEQLIENLEVKPGKRVRLPSWQRRKRRKKLMLQDLGTQESSRNNLNDKGDLLKTYQHGSVDDKCQGLAAPILEQGIEDEHGADVKSDNPVSETTSVQLCPCCSVFQSLSRVPKSSAINMKPMFYNLKPSSSLFLRKHVFYSLKSGVSGVNDLLRRIFGLPNKDTRNLPASCFHKRGRCSQQFACLYHSLIKLLRKLLYRAKKCRHKILLEKHCPFRPLFQPDGDGNGDGDALSTHQCSNSSKMESVLSSSTQDMNQGIEQMDKRLSHTKTRNCKRTTEGIQKQFGLNRPYCLKGEVAEFVWAACRSIVPPELLGSASSCRILRRNISRFIRLRRFEKFSVKQCLHKLDVSRFPLISNMDSFKCYDAFSKKIPGILPKSQDALKQMLLERWIFWLFSHIVVPLVQANFYVTESEHGKQKLYYYRKSVWRKLSGRVIRWLKDQTYRSLDNASVAQILSKRSFGFSKVRLCPKENGARPIANLKAPSRFCFKGSLSHAWLSGKQRKERADSKDAHFLKPVNTVLQDLHVILKDVKVKEPERWGSTVFSHSDIHRKLCSFLRHLKEGQTGMPSVYIVVSDVEKAFDTVKQDKLLSILNEIQMEDTYSLQRSCEIFCMKKSLWISKNLKLVNQGNNSDSTEVIPHLRRRNCQTIVVNQDQSMTIRRRKLYSILKEHLKNNVLQLGQRFYLQTVGIPQGSVLSTLLCTLYYGHMERNVIFPYLAKCAHDNRADNYNGSAVLEVTPEGSFTSPKYLLLRFVDDFLFISTSKYQATSFLSRLRRGVHAYNCFMNQDKFCTNFDSGGKHKLDSNKLLVGNDGVSYIKWSGLLINSCSLEVQADYSRYLSDHLSSTLTVNWQQRPGRHLKNKLFFYMQPKCHPMLFDASINSPATVRLNIYQAFVVCAMKFHCFVRQLSFWCKIQPGSCLSSIEKSVRYMYKLMMRKMHRVKCGSDCHHVLKVGRKEVIWLGLTAYIRVLSRKRSRHTELLRLLSTKLAAVSGVGSSSKLKYAVDDSHSSYLWKIKY